MKKTVKKEINSDNIVYKRFLSNYRIFRHIVQVLFIVLFFSQLFGLPIYFGSLISSNILGLDLTDPLAMIEVILSSKEIHVPLLISGGIVLAFFALIGGRFFCGWVCPFYLVSEMVDKIREHIKIRNVSVEKSFKYWFMFTILFISFAISEPLFQYFSPPGILLRAFIDGIGISIVFILAILFIEVFYSKRVWCKSLCPIGAFYSVISKFSRLQISVNKKTCTNCMKCHEQCIEMLMLKPITDKSEGFEKVKDKNEVESIFSGECTYCFKCYDVCPERAISFGGTKK
ncbi:MAG: NapH/MauN family ferredoxin-type protein [Spirochaetia bacterium]|nr:NapH/MauN family ferredoxin-type protein [Spirochaetia bacterium]